MRCCSSVPRLGALVLCLTLAAATGCGLPPFYLTEVALGEVDLLSRAVPIEEGLNDLTLTDDEREKLALVIRARDYAQEVIGLNVDGSFQSFVNLNGDSLAWNLSASRKDALEPYVWPLPLLPPTSYLGFFSYHEAIQERDRLVSLGWDTFLFEVDAYALSFLPDPLFTPALRREIPDLADTVMHELLHNTIMTVADANFNESLAVFVGRTAGLQFLEADYGSDHPILECARQRYEDADRREVFLAEMIAELNALYQSDETSEVKIARREEIFEASRQRFTADVLPLMHNPDRYEVFSTFPFNNAYLLVNIRYGSEQDLFRGIYEMVGEDWSSALAVFAEAATTGNPFQTLRNLLPT